ncbi:MAG: DUF255 domain-containing protein [Candidatus Eisenbacteria bacterium]
MQKTSGVGPRVIQAALVAVGFLALVAGGVRAEDAGNGKEIEWAATFDQALEQARTEKKIIMVDFFTHWCHWCKVLDEKTYSDPRVVEASRAMVNVKVNAGTYVDIAKKYGVSAYPTVAFLKPDGSLRMSVRGFRPPESFLPQMESALAVGGQLLAVKNQVEDRPDEPRLRRQLIDLLALDGKWSDAASQCAELVGLVPEEERSGVELDQILYRMRAGEDVVSSLRDWEKHHRDDPRSLEARYYLAMAQEAAGEHSAARKGFQEVAESGGKSWLAAAANEVSCGTSLRPATSQVDRTIRKASKAFSPAIRQKTEPGPKGT